VPGTMKPACPQPGIRAARERVRMNHVEPTENQKKAFTKAFVVLIIILASVALLILIGGALGWLPKWEPMPK
jgi:hypothetical protein